MTTEPDHAATLHVTIDALATLRKLIEMSPTADAHGNPASPWMDYYGEPDDLLTTREGYLACLAKAEDDATAALNAA